jgi:hypothetical protein
VQRAELRADEITKTLETLLSRIENRFPGSGLSGVCRELIEFSTETKLVMDWVVRPIWWLRLSVGGFVALAVVGIVYTVSRLNLSLDGLSVGDLIQALEATTSEILLIAAGLFFLISLETRVKRARVVQALNELRAVAHIVDMKQLTKDPDNPKREMDDLKLGRYLDYCSELLSLVSKIGFLYVTRFDDPDANQSVNELESLTSGLSRKIWQKISILHQRRLFADVLEAKPLTAEPASVKPELALEAGNG